MVAWKIRSYAIAMLYKSSGWMTNVWFLCLVVTIELGREFWIQPSFTLEFPNLRQTPSCTSFSYHIYSFNKEPQDYPKKRHGKYTMPILWYFIGVCSIFGLAWIISSLIVIFQQGSRDLPCQSTAPLKGQVVQPFSSILNIYIYCIYILPNILEVLREHYQVPTFLFQLYLTIPLFESRVMPTATSPIKGWEWEACHLLRFTSKTANSQPAKGSAQRSNVQKIPR